METDREDRSAAGRRSQEKREEGSFGAGILKFTIKARIANMGSDCGSTKCGTIDFYLW